MVRPRTLLDRAANLDETSMVETWDSDHTGQSDLPSPRCGDDLRLNGGSDGAQKDYLRATTTRYLWSLKREPDVQIEGL